MAIRAVVFDLFDTLVDLLSEDIPLEKVAGRRIPNTLRRLHSLLPEEAGVEFAGFVEAMVEVDRSFRRSHYAEGRELPSIVRFEAVMVHLGLDLPGLVERMVAAHMGAIRDLVRPVEHHPEVLAGLREHAQIGLCSNFSHAGTALDVLEESSLGPHIDAVVISETIGVRKPRPEIFEATLELLGVRADETLHVGDSLAADVAGAAAVGIR